MRKLPSLSPSPAPALSDGALDIPMASVTNPDQYTGVSRPYADFHRPRPCSHPECGMTPLQSLIPMVSPDRGQRTYLQPTCLPAVCLGVRTSPPPAAQRALQGPWPSVTSTQTQLHSESQIIYIFFFFFLRFIYLFLERGKGGREEHQCVVALCAPYWGPGP